MSREAKAQRQVPEQGRCSIIALPTVIVLGMTSAAVLGAAGQNVSSLIIDAAASHEIRVRKSVKARSPPRSGGLYRSSSGAETREITF